MTRLEYNLFTKRALKFKDGKFRILIFSDMHMIKNYDTRMIRDMDAIIDGVNPDIVLLNGDQVWRDGAGSVEDIRNCLAGAVSPMEKRGIPWAHVFGNHDDESGVSNEEQQGIYEEFKYCLSKRGPEDVAGTGNYVLPVYSSDGSKIAYNIWGLDSHDSMNDYIREFGLRTDPWFFKLPDPLFPFSGYDSLRFNQIMWYWNSSEELNAHNGGKIPGMMFFHIPIPEFVTLYRNSAQTFYEGNRRESVGNGPFNPGLFNALVERGEVRTVVCGHDHINDFEGEFCNIRLAMDGGIAYDGYCDTDMRGGRVIDITEQNPYDAITYMVRALEYVENYPGEEKRIFGDEPHEQ